jgi:DNA-binding transcriptional MerR regulator
VDIKQLASEAGTPVRMVRYLISEGFVDPPKMLTKDKASASYGERHLTQLRLYLHMKDAGLSQNDIRERISERSPAEMLAGIDEVVRRIAPGIELKVTASLVPANADADEIKQRIMGALAVLGIETEKGKAHADAENQDD